MGYTEEVFGLLCQIITIYFGNTLATHTGGGGGGVKSKGDPIKNNSLISKYVLFTVTNVFLFLQTDPHRMLVKSRVCFMAALLLLVELGECAEKTNSSELHQFTAVEFYDKLHSGKMMFVYFELQGRYKFFTVLRKC